MPGEFVWQPGSLTVAVTQGHWVLLEDVDYAPMDVISTLVPLLEGGTLSLPGHGDQIRAHPAFRLFATRRCVFVYCAYSSFLIVYHVCTYHCTASVVWEVGPGVYYMMDLWDGFQD